MPSKKKKRRAPLPDPHDVVLVHVDEAANVRRHYAIRVTCEPLFGRMWLDLEWGRIGARRMKTKRETCASARELAARWRAVLALRERHGYVVAKRWKTPRKPCKRPSIEGAQLGLARVAT